MMAIQFAVGFALVLFLQGCYGQTDLDITSAGVFNVLGSNGWVPFSCRRPGDACYGGVCQTDGTSCVCTGTGVTNGGVDCNPVRDSPTTGCPDDCSGHGNCYTVGATPTCVCDPMYAGDNCDRFRAYVQCNLQSMAVQVYPQKTQDAFQGQISIQKRGSVELINHSSCQKSYTDPFWSAALNRFIINFRTVNTSNPCVDGLYTLTGTDGNFQACYDLRLQYLTAFQSAEDEVFRLCCNENTNMVDNTVDVGTGNDGDTGANVTGAVQVVDYDLVWTATRMSVPASSVLQIGDKISYVVTLATGTRYTDFRVTKCTAEPSGYPLVTNRCPDPGATSLVVDIQKNGLEISVDLSAWLPTDSNFINVTCATDVCVGSCGVTETCDKTQVTNFGRKKRQAGDEGGERETVYSSKTFYIGLDIPERSCPVSAPCTIQHVNSVYIPVVVVFGVLLLIALAISIFMCIKLRSREQKETSSLPPKAYYNNASMS